MTLTLRHWAASHPGTVRTDNEDAYTCRPEIGLFSVADGVGGHAGGGEASSAVMSALGGIAEGLSPPDLLSEVRARLQGVHDRLHQESEPRQAHGMATTVVVLLLRGEHMACVWAGDSRAYLLRGGQLVPITSDHSVVGEMVRAGKLTDEQALRHPKSNIITRGIGVPTDEPLVEKVIGTVEAGDRYLLCSDGLTKVLTSDTIATCLTDDEPAERLLRAALEANATDNVTVLVASV